MAEQTFKDRNPELQQLVLEWRFVRNWNAGCPPEVNRLLLAEGVLALLTLERFLRVLVRSNETLDPLLRRAAALKLITLPGPSPDDAIRRICQVRNTLLHANYEQAADATGQPHGRAYLEEVYSAELRTLSGVVAHLLNQIDAVTGLPKAESGDAS